MTKSPWQTPLTGTPLDYVPIDAPISAIIPYTPDRPSRLWGYVYVLATFCIGILLGALL